MRDADFVGEMLKNYKGPVSMETARAIKNLYDEAIAECARRQEELARIERGQHICKEGVRCVTCYVEGVQDECIRLQGELSEANARLLRWYNAWLAGAPPDEEEREHVEAMILRGEWRR